MTFDINIYDNLSEDKVIGFPPGTQSVGRHSILSNATSLKTVIGWHPSLETVTFFLFHVTYLSPPMVTSKLPVRPITRFADMLLPSVIKRSEERRVGKESRYSRAREKVRRTGNTE